MGTVREWQYPALPMIRMVHVLFEDAIMNDLKSACVFVHVMHSTDRACILRTKVDSAAITAKWVR